MEKRKIIHNGERKLEDTLKRKGREKRRKRNKQLVLFTYKK